MPKLPVFNSTGQVNAQQPSVLRDPQAEGQGGRNLQGLSNAAQSVANVWQQAKDFSETLAKDNADKISIANILQEGQSDPDHRNGEVYQKQLGEIFDRSGEGFSSNIARGKYQLSIGNDLANAKIQLNGLFRKKNIDFVRSELITSHDIHKKAYIATGNFEHQQIQREAIEIARQKGFVDNIFVANENLKIDDWEQFRYLQMADEGLVEEAVDLIKKSDLSPTDKSAAFSNIESIAKNQSFLIQIDDVLRQQKMIGDARNVINDPDTTYIDKLNFIQQQEKFGMKGSSVDLVNKYLNSNNRLTASTHNDRIRQTLNRIGTFEKGIDKDSPKKDLLKYLKEVQSAREGIMSDRIDGKITELDEDALIKALDEKVNMEEALAVGKVKKSDVWVGHHFFDWGYPDADKFFLNQFQDNRLNSDSAMVEYFRRVEGKKLSNDERKEEAKKVADDVRSGLRQATLERLKGSRAAPVKESEAQVIERLKVSDKDITDTMQAEGWSRSQVIDYLRSR